MYQLQILYISTLQILYVLVTNIVYFYITNIVCISYKYCIFLHYKYCISCVCCSHHAIELSAPRDPQATYTTFVHESETTKMVSDFSRVEIRVRSLSNPRLSGEECTCMQMSHTYDFSFCEKSISSPFGSSLHFARCRKHPELY